MCSASGHAWIACVGFPIRRPPDQSLYTAPRGFSQCPASFIGVWRQGIHRKPLVAFFRDAENSMLFTSCMGRFVLRNAFFVLRSARFVLRSAFSIRSFSFFAATCGHTSYTALVHFVYLRILLPIFTVCFHTHSVVNVLLVSQPGG
jgi:hypothetical protein